MVGPLKGSFGVILSTRTKDDATVVDVRTTATNTVHTFAEDGVRELM
jgi:hypothetical protein